MYTSTTKEAKKIKIHFEDQITNQPSFTLKFFAWSTVSEIKKELEKHIKTSHQNMRLFYKNLELSKNGRRLIDYNVKNKEIFVVKMTPQLEDSLGVLNPYRIFEEMPEAIHEMLEGVKTGFLKSIKPKLAETGTSGSYFLENYAHKIVAIFKPFDEEPFAPNNPRNFRGELGGHGFRRGILSGESATREVAAYMLNDSYHGVPATTYVEFYHPSFEEREFKEEGPIKSETYYKIADHRTKHGSLQAFVPHDDMVCNFGCNVFSVEEIHKIAILDLRILNCDRNEENILVKKSAYYVETSQGQKLKKDYKLTPIDHGLSFPDNLHIYDYEVIWMEYPQVRQPFTERELQFIKEIDPVSDCTKLREKLGFREICLRNFRIAQTLLKMAAEMGFTIHDVGRMLYRKEPESLDSDEEENRPKDADLSEIEKLIIEAENMYFVVKENGIKSTIEYQIGLIRPRRNNESPLKLLQLNAIHEEEDSDTEANHQPSKRNIETKRSVSLPSIKKHPEREEELSKPKEKEKGKRDKQENGMVSARQKRIENEHWEEIFFHYFEDMLKRFLKDKQSKTIKRNRFKSEVVQ